MNIEKRLKHITTIGSLVYILTACGGGGSTPAPGPNPGPAPITPVNTPPAYTLNLSSADITKGSTVTASVSGFSDESALEKCVLSIDKDGDGIVDLSGPANISLSFTASTAGSYTLSTFLKDDGTSNVSGQTLTPQTTTKTIAYTVKEIAGTNAAPTISFSTAKPKYEIGDIVTFTTSIADDYTPAPRLSGKLDFSNSTIADIVGGASTNATTYSTLGVKTASLKALDDGATSTGVYSTPLTQTATAQVEIVKYLPQSDNVIGAGNQITVPGTNTVAVYGNNVLNATMMDLKVNTDGATLSGVTCGTGWDCIFNQVTNAGVPTPSQYIINATRTDFQPYNIGPVEQVLSLGLTGFDNTKTVNLTLTPTVFDNNFNGTSRPVDYAGLLPK